MVDPLKPLPPRPRRKRLGRWFRRGLIVAVGLAATALIATAWIPKPIFVETAVIQTDDMIVTVDEDGRTRVKDRYIISAPLSGNLARMAWRAGDEVSQGVVLARIMPLEAPLLDARSLREAEARVAGARAAQKQARAQIDRLVAAADLARHEADRLAALAMKGSQPRAIAEKGALDLRMRTADVESARFAARVADYELEVAEAALLRIKGRGDTNKRVNASRASAANDADTQYYEVRSPVAGKVLKVIQESQGVVSPGTPLLELGDPKALELVVDVLTRDAVHISRGAQASIERWGGDPLHATVRLVEPSAFTRLSALGVEEQRANVILDLVEPYEHWQNLGDGYRIDASITVWRGESVLQVPESALFRHNNEWAVFAVRDDEAVLTEVKIGRRNGRAAQVEEGLEAQARVILHPSDRIEQGVQVTWRK